MEYAVIAGAVLLLLAGLSIFLYDQNNRLCISKFEIESEKLTGCFTALHLSDLHDKTFGKKNERLIKKIRERKPDVIFFTGDLIYKRSKHFQNGIEFLRMLKVIAPVYAILGNHECEYPKRETAIQSIRETGVCLLINEEKKVNINGNMVYLLGMAERLISKQKVKEISSQFEDREGYKILLSHYPHYFSRFRNVQYKDYKVDLVLTGHTHGAQMILPGIGGIYAPDQGFFPKYYRGSYEENGTKMIVSRGLGKSVFPFRIFNRPEIVEIQFSRK